MIQILLNNKRNRKIAGRVLAVLLVMILSVISAPVSYGFTEADEPGALPVRQAHRVKVGDSKYCVFVCDNAVLTPGKISKMTDNELTVEILRRSGFYMMQANCRKAEHEAIDTEGWIKNGGSFMLSQNDIDRLRDAHPSDGSPVKLHMDLLISPDPYVEEKEESEVSDEKQDRDQDQEPEDSEDQKPGSEEQEPESGDDQEQEPEAAEDGEQDPEGSEDQRPGSEDQELADSEEQKSESEEQEPEDSEDQEQEPEAAEDGEQAPEGSEDQKSESEDQEQENGADQRSEAAEDEDQEPVIEGDQPDAGENDDKQESEPAEKKQPEKNSRRSYSTSKLLSPELLFVVVATKADVSASEDECREARSADRGDKSDESADADSGEDMLPEYRTIAMIERKGEPLEDTLKDGTPVTLTWVEPDEHADVTERSALHYLPAAIAGLAAAAVAAGVMIRRKKNRSPE